MSFEAKGGLTGKILRVNLSNGEIWTENTSKYAEKFIGGRAINSYILLKETAPGTKWSDPDCLLIVGAGCLCGTIAPAACRTSIDTINAYNNGKGSANFGGFFGPELKYAGFDHVVVTGKSSRPVYLWICDGQAEIKDAGPIWGKTNHETQEFIQNELRDPGIRVCSIGPAGENRVIGAAIHGDTAKAAGGSGTGCVMGEKKLKAIAVRGHRAVKVADPDRFAKIVDECIKKIISNPTTHNWRRSGIMTGGFLPDSPAWDLCAMPRNGQDEYWPMDQLTRLCDEHSGVSKFKTRITACPTCLVGCIPYNKIDEGPYKGTEGSGYWANSAMYSTKFDVSDPDASVKWHLLTNAYGIDGDMAAATCSWAFECYEKGLITKEDTDGLELTWGNGYAMVELLKKVVFREGIGDLLADGVFEAAKRIGQGSEDFALHVKGQPTIEHFRVVKGWGLGTVTSTCSGRHLRGSVILPELCGPPDYNYSMTSYEDAPKAVFWQGRTKEIEDMVGICVYMGSFQGVYELFPPDYTEMIISALGIEINEDQLNHIARKGWNLEKAFNTLHVGFTRKNDLPPKRFMEEPVKNGKYAGMKADREGYEKMLDEFYRLHNWDIETGWQTRTCMEELDLNDVASMLESVGRLIER